MNNTDHNSKIQQLEARLTDCRRHQKWCVYNGDWQQYDYCQRCIEDLLEQIEQIQNA